MSPIACDIRSPVGTDLEAFVRVKGKGIVFAPFLSGTDPEVAQRHVVSRGVPVVDVETGAIAP